MRPGQMRLFELKRLHRPSQSQTEQVTQVYHVEATPQDLGTGRI